MTVLTKKESEALLALFKDFSTDYNANSLSKKLDITPRGALKVLKSLDKQRLVTGKQYGKAVFYKANLGDYYAFRTVETLLIAEARENAPRWLAEFKELFKYAKIAIIFGSVVREPQKANDIDLLLVFDEKNINAVKKFIKEKNSILLKPIHLIMQSESDIKNNLKGRDPVVLNALKQGYVLSGYDKLIEAVKHATSI